MKNDIEIFKNYVINNYDINNKLIKEKVDHSISVSMIMLDLALRLDLNNDDAYLAFLIGLFHDLGRFKEIEINKKMNNLKFDHGACSNKILFNDGFIDNFNIAKDDYLVIKKAIYYHNKKDIDLIHSSRENLFIQMIRDADKIDIIDVMIKKGILVFNTTPNKIVLKNYFQGNTTNISDIKSRTDQTILYLSFIKDLYFPESKEIAKEKHSLNKMIRGIKPEFNYQELYNHLVSKVYSSNDHDIKKYIKK